MFSLKEIFNIVKPIEEVFSIKRMAKIIGFSGQISLRNLISRAHLDTDYDGLQDFWEQLLAERYAPIIYHSSDESNFPTNVDWFLRKTELRFYDDNCTPDFDISVIVSPTQRDLLNHSIKGGCGSNDIVYSNGTRSKNKQRTFYLKDVSEEFRKGSLDSLEWITYYHSYPNDLGGVTIQYWRFYSYNDAASNHGGDWEGIHVILDRNLQPAKIGYLTHATIDSYLPSELQWESTHVRVFSEGGGHASFPNGNGIKAEGGPGYIDIDYQETFVRQETWGNGNVVWYNGKRSKTGPLINLGSKIAPMNGQVFIQYSGLWGSPGTFSFSSGYWGPAFNETGMKEEDGFITAWAVGMIGESDFLRRECYPSASCR